MEPIRPGESGQSGLKSDLGSAETWLRKNAPGYEHLAPEERQALSDFVALWSVYEARVLDCNATAARMLDTIEQWNAIGLLDNDGSEATWSYFVARYTTGADVSDHFRGLRFQSAAHKEQLRSALLQREPPTDALTRHKAMALIIHRIRNNLLHGEKWAYGLADQLENFRHAGHMLMVWTDMQSLAAHAQPEE